MAVTLAKSCHWIEFALLDDYWEHFKCQSPSTCIWPLQDLRGSPQRPAPAHELCAPVSGPMITITQPRRQGMGTGNQQPVLRQSAAMATRTEWWLQSCVCQCVCVHRKYPCTSFCVFSMHTHTHTHRNRIIPAEDAIVAAVGQQPFIMFLEDLWRNAQKPTETMEIIRTDYYV